MADALKLPNHPIALVGLMGAGKSTIGRRLARRLGLPFVDADDEVEATMGLTVAEIFDRFGEARFREEERRVIARLVDGPPRVIATGGGAFIDPATRALILARCTTIWLDGEVEVLAARAARHGGRPLLDAGDPVGVLERLAETRNPLYAQAHFRVRSDESAVETIVGLLG